MLLQLGNEYLPQNPELGPTVDPVVGFHHGIVLYPFVANLSRYFGST